MPKLLIEVGSCLECPFCEEQEVHVPYVGHLLINACPECDGEPDDDCPYGPEALERLNGRYVGNDEGEVVGVPEWCPHLYKDQ